MRDIYVALFAGMAPGMAPASRPRLVMVVVIDGPSNGEYDGVAVAAPVFSRVIGGMLRILNIAPDDLSTLSSLTGLSASRSIGSRRLNVIEPERRG